MVRILMIRVQKDLLKDVDVLIQVRNVPELEGQRLETCLFFPRIITYFDFEFPST